MSNLNEQSLEQYLSWKRDQVSGAEFELELFDFYQRFILPNKFMVTYKEKMVTLSRLERHGKSPKTAYKTLREIKEYNRIRYRQRKHYRKERGF